MPATNTLRGHPRNISLRRSPAAGMGQERGGSKKGCHVQVTGPWKATSHTSHPNKAPSRFPLPLFPVAATAEDGRQGRSGPPCGEGKGSPFPCPNPASLRSRGAAPARIPHPPSKIDLSQESCKSGRGSCSSLPFLIRGVASAAGGRRGVVSMRGTRWYGRGGPPSYAHLRLTNSL